VPFQESSQGQHVFPAFGRLVESSDSIAPVVPFGLDRAPHGRSKDEEVAKFERVAIEKVHIRESVEILYVLGIQMCVCPLVAIEFPIAWYEDDVFPETRGVIYKVSKGFGRNVSNVTRQDEDVLVSFEPWESERVLDEFQV
jgi:hypothetical protein